MQTYSPFYDNVRYNTKRMKCRTTKRAKVGLHKVGPAEVLEKLKQLGIEMTDRSLRNWTYRYKVLTKPKTGTYGQGGGKWADYPDEVIPEAVTAYILRERHRLTMKEIAEGKENPESDNGIVWAFHYALFTESEDLENSMEPSFDFVKQYNQNPAVKRYYARSREKLREIFG